MTADFPEGVFVRGARRIDSSKKYPDNLGEETEAHQNESLRTVTWIWVIVRPTILRTSMLYSKVSIKGLNIQTISGLYQISTIVSVLTVSLIPFITLMVLNYLIFRAIQKKTFIISDSAKRVRRELHIATILISIVTLFIICHILKFIINMLELVSVLIGEYSFFKLNVNLLTRFQSF